MEKVRKKINPEIIFTRRTLVYLMSEVACYVKHTFLLFPVIYLNKDPCTELRQTDSNDRYIGKQTAKKKKVKEKQTNRKREINKNNRKYKK